MNINRRNITKSVSAMSLVGLSGCVSAFGTSDDAARILRHSITKDNDSFIIEIETDDGNIENIDVDLYTTPYSNLFTDDSVNENILQSYKLTNFTEVSEKEYHKEIPKSTVNQQIPVHETLSIGSLIAFNEENSTNVLDKSIVYGSNSEKYYITKFRDGTIIDQYMVRDNYPTRFKDYENTISNYEKWAENDTIYIHMNFYISQRLLSLKRVMLYHEFNKDSDTILPFNITISIPKKEKKAVEEITENPYPDITYKDFKKTIDHHDLGQHKYYERPIFNSIATQITEQFDTYKSDISDVYTSADIRILRRLYDVFVSYDKEALEDNYSDVVYPSQAFIDRKTDCEGTTFTVAGIAYHLGYDVSIQALTRENESYPFHVQPAAGLDNERLARVTNSNNRSYRYPSKKSKDASKSSMKHFNIHPVQPIAHSPKQWDYYNDDAPTNTISVLTSLEH